MAIIEWTPQGTIVLYSKYNSQFVDWLRNNVPKTDKTWNPAEKNWEIAGKHFQEVKAAVKTYYRWVDIQGTKPAIGTQTKTFTLDYIGQLKRREDGTAYSSGTQGEGGWNIVFPAETLAAYFGFDLTEEKEANPDNFFTVLGVSKNADIGAIKKGYRRAARAVHPDVNKEPDAHDQFLLVQKAYETLSDDILRKKYLLGIMLHGDKPIMTASGDNEVLWKPVIKCGIITARIEQAGRWVIKEILDWQDQVNDFGQTRVTYWTGGLDGHWLEKWVL